MDQSSSDLFVNVGGIVFHNAVSACRYLNPFRRYSQSKSEVVRNRAEFRMFWPFQIFGVQAPKKLYPNSHACFAAHHVEKFREVTQPSPRVIGAHTLNFKGIFVCSLFKIVGGSPSPQGCALASLGHSLERVKI